MFRKTILVMVGAIALFAAGCTRSGIDKDSPEKTLSDYIGRSFTLTNFDEKEKLQELTTGEVKDTLDKLDADSFKRHFVDSKRKFVSLKIKDERKLDDDRYSITYELTYTSKSGESDDKVTNKKHAVFARQDGKWLISEVRNIKTYIEHQNELSF